MSITKRRLDFLKTLINLSKESGLPVHYTDVADNMKISKWTAYDILKELEKEGYVETKYLLNTEKTQGRSMLMFLPTERAYEVLKVSNNEDWDKLRSNLLTKIKMDDSNFMEEVLNEMFNTTTPIEFCAYALTAFFLKLKMLGEGTISNIESNLLLCVNPNYSLILFTGAILGILIYTKVKNDIDFVLSENMEKFYKYLNELNNHEMYKLYNFLKEIISYA